MGMIFDGRSDGTRRRMMVKRWQRQTTTWPLNQAQMNQTHRSGSKEPKKPLAPIYTKDSSEFFGGSIPWRSTPAANTRDTFGEVQQKPRENSQSIAW